MIELSNEELSNKITALEGEVESLKRTVNVLSGTSHQLPRTNILSNNFLTRAFAVYGHVFVAGLLIAIVFYCIVFGIMLSLGVSLGSMFNNW